MVLVKYKCMYAAEIQWYIVVCYDNTTIIKLVTLPLS